MIKIDNVTLMRGEKTLLSEASFSLYSGQKVGLIGANGAGKTSLFLLLLDELQPADGEILIPEGQRFAHIRQEMPSGAQTALSYSIQGDAEYDHICRQLDMAEESGDGEAMMLLHEKLDAIDGYAIESRASKILLGLGFSQHEMQQPVESFSGGWRMRLNLAQVLLSRAELLLLDEPTNHLDLESIMWLEDWLIKTKQTVLLISHDREFLDKVVTHIASLSQCKLKQYVGNYSAYERQYAEQLAIQQATFQKQQAAREHLQSFVDRFRAKASKAKQAQSRLKMLAKMDVVSAVHAASPFKFSFRDTQPAGTPMIRLDKASVGYENNAVLNNLDISINDGDRIGLVGPNGAGKSTFIKLLSEKLMVMSGAISRSKKLRIGYFAQHQLEQLDMDLSPIQQLWQIESTVTESQARKYLAGFNFRGDDVFRACHGFSGGEKARLVMALLIWQSPNLLLLDEPTNHLDIEVREALSMALQEYQGAVIIVSHDRYLLTTVAEQLWLVADGAINKFVGDVDDYHQWYLSYIKNQSGQASPVKLNDEDAKKIEKQINALESEHVKLLEKLSTLDSKLEDQALYLPNNKPKLDKLVEDRVRLSKNITELESEVFKLMESL